MATTTNGTTRPVYGRRLIPNVIDDNARERPQEECFSYPRSSDPNDGWKLVTWKEFANSINHVAGASSSSSSSSSSSRGEEEEPSGYYHGVNPSSTTWGPLAAAVQDFYGKERIPRLTDTFDEWVDLLEESSRMDNTARNLEKNPGVKLIDSYRGMAAGGGGGNPVTLDMDKTKKRSPAMAGATAVTPELMKLWCKQWAYV